MKYDQSAEVLKQAAAASQRATLHGILVANRDTLYGREHCFHAIVDEEGFQTRVPLNPYQNLEPYITKIKEGAENVLFKEPIKAFFETSGTASTPKLIPVTSSSIRDKIKAMNFYWSLVYQQFPELSKKKIISNFSSGASFSYTERGIPICSETDYWNLITRNIKEPDRWPIIYEVLKIKEFETRYYLIALLLLQDEVAAFMSPNPSTILVLLQIIERQFPDFIKDLYLGEVNPNVIPKGSLGSEIAGLLRPSVTRARHLDACLTSGGRISFNKVWPTLTLYICWQSAMLKPYTDRLSSYLPNIDCWDHLYQASEAIIAIPNRPNERGGLLNMMGNFYEFIPYGDYEQCVSPLTIQKLVEGQRYEIIVTNFSGLYRYRIGDTIRVIEFEGGIPRVEFTGRTGKVCSMTGEKLTEEQVVQAFESCKDALSHAPENYLVFPVDADLPHYGLIFGSDAPLGLEELHCFAREYEKQLRELNVEYRAKRESNRLSGIQVFVVEENSPNWLQQAHGPATDQEKPVRLTNSFNEHENHRIIGRVATT
jgi:hypothetical protein